MRADSLKGILCISNSNEARRNRKPTDLSRPTGRRLVFINTKTLQYITINGRETIVRLLLYNVEDN
jgi:hypothetical protein